MPQYNTLDLLRPSEVQIMNLQSELQSKENLYEYFTRKQMEVVTTVATGQGRSPNLTLILVLALKKHGERRFM
jgi:hypothetical protein